MSELRQFRMNKGENGSGKYSELYIYIFFTTNFHVSDQFRFVPVCVFVFFFVQ